MKGSIAISGVSVRTTVSLTSGSGSASTAGASFFSLSSDPFDATGDAQAKLLRQIETLQSQYAVASENWQGIEASLIARATNLEKERDEATKREADIRRKAREVVSLLYNLFGITS